MAVLQRDIYAKGREKLKILQVICNHFHNILRLFDILRNFPFTTSESMRDYYL